MSSTSNVLLVHYLPIATTLVSAIFSGVLFRRYFRRPTPHIFWWAIGVAFYGLGTLIEATITLTGNSVFLTKAWYIAGAILGGYPLAQGSLYLSYPRRVANRLTAISLPFVVIASILVILSPVNFAALEPHRPSGAILAWKWVRLLTPFINTYAAFFLIGGAIVSAWRFHKTRGEGYRAAGNTLIAIGALLPGIGGSFAKAGLVEALYVAEFVGLLVIWLGERVCARRHARTGASVIPNFNTPMTTTLRAFFLVAAVLTARPLLAAEISGKAADITGAALPSARITILNVATGASTTVESDGSGNFSSPDLPGGTYQVTASFPGLADESRTIRLDGAGRGTSLEFLLKPGDLLEDVTVTATRGERDALLVPLRTDTLGREEIQNLTPLSTGDALTNAPGITPVGGGPFGVRPRLRGLDSTRLLILVDGERLNNARTATDRAGTEVGLVDIGTVESLEVVGGAGSVLYGTDALAGTINIITNPLRFSDQLRLTYGFDGLYSSNENGRRGTVSIGATSKRLSFQFSGSMENFDNYTAGKGGANESSQRFYDNGTITQADTIDDNFGFNFNAFPDPFNAPFTRTTAVIPFSAATGNNINASAAYAIDERQTVSVKYIRRRMEDVGFPDFEPPQFFSQTSLPFNNFDRVSARYEARSLTPWFTSLRVAGYWQDQDRSLRTVFPVQFPAPSAAFFPISVFRLNLTTETRQHVQTPGVDVQATLLPARKHVLTVGTMLYQDQSRDSRTNTTQQTMIGNVSLGSRGPQANVFPEAVVLGAPSVTHPTRVPDAQFSNLGLFAQDEWEIADRLRLVAGLRFDRYNVRTEATPGYDVESLVAGAKPAIDPNTLPNVEGDRIARSAVTGDVGLVFRASDAVSLTARYGRSYRHANLEEMLFSGPATVGSIVPNVLVKPETGNNLDFGVKLRGKRVSGSLSYFNNAYDGFISTEIVSIGTSGPLSQAINFSDVRIQGIEGDAELPMPTRLGVFTLFGTFAFTRGDVLRGTNPLTGASLDNTPADNISPSKVMPGLRFADVRDRYWVEYSARWQDNVSRVAPTLLDSPYLIAQDLLSLEGFTLHRLAWGVNVGQAQTNRLGLVFAVENLTDVFYREQFQFAPSRGRTFTVALHLRGH